MLAPWALLMGDDRAPRSVGLNVGANTNEPGFRAPIDDAGRFEFIPIPETATTTEPVPTYGELGLDTPIPSEHRETPVHLDPAFAEYPHCERYTYGDPFGVKARPLLELGTGDWVWFYATLATGPDPPPDQPPRWGAFLIGGFRLAREPLSAEAFASADAQTRALFAGNAHLKRDPVDAKVLLHGEPDASRLFEHAVPLSAPSAGTDPNEIVTGHSADSGKGPWWRRPLRFDASGTAAVRRRIDAVQSGDGP